MFCWPLKLGLSTFLNPRKFCTSISSCVPPIYFLLFLPRLLLYKSWHLTVISIFLNFYFLLSNFPLLNFYNVYFYLLIFSYPGSSLLCGLFSSYVKQGLLSSCGAWASHCGGFSYYGAQTLGYMGFSSCDMWAQ